MFIILGSKRLVKAFGRRFLKPRSYVAIGIKDKNSGGPNEDLANLQGKRFVMASEIEEWGSARLVVAEFTHSHFFGGPNILKCYPTVVYITICIIL